MMASILDSAILHKTLTQTISIWLKLIYSHSTWWWQPSWILPSSIQPFCTKKNFTHSFWLNLMMAAILNSAMLWFIHCHLGFRHLYIFSQIHSKTLSLHSDSDSNYFNLNQTHSFLLDLMMAAILNSSILLKILTPTNSIWLQLIHSHSTWWWEQSWILPSWNLPSWIQPSYYFLSNSLTLAKIGSHHLHQKNFTHSFWLNLMMATILNSAILDSNTLLSSLRFTQKHSLSTLTLTQTNSIWLKLINSHSTWWWQHSKFCQFAFIHLSFPSQTHSHLPRLVPTICTKMNFTHSFWLNLMMAAILNSAMLDSDTAFLDSDTLLSTVRFTQKHFHSTLTLTQTNSIWLKLIHSYLIWWW